MPAYSSGSQTRVEPRRDYSVPLNAVLGPPRVWSFDQGGLRTGIVSVQVLPLPCWSGDHTVRTW